MAKHAMAEATAVAVRIAPGSIPDALRIAGFKARIYTMVMNVVRPAISSVRTFVPRSESLKSFSNIYF